MKNKPKVYKRIDSQWWWCSWSTETGRKTFSLQPYNISSAEYSRERAQAQAEIIAMALTHSRTPEQKTLGWFKNTIEDALGRDGTRDGTIETYLYAIDSLIAFLGANFAVSDIMSTHVNRYKDFRLKQGIKPYTINSQCGDLRACFGRIADFGIIGSNPFVRFKKIPVRNVARKSMTIDEVCRFLIAMNEWKPKLYRMKPEYYEGLKRLMYIYLYTARRRSEPLMLNRADVDLQKNTINMPLLKQRNVTHTLIDIPAEIKSHLEWFLETFRGDPLFRNFKKDQLTRYAKKWMQLAGLPEHYHLHSIRHTAITLAVRQSGNLRQIQDYVGHSTITVTESYVHTDSLGVLDLGYDFTAQKQIENNDRSK